MNCRNSGSISAKLIVSVFLIIAAIMMAVPYYLTNKVTTTIGNRILYSGEVDECIGTICHSSSGELKKNQVTDIGAMWSKQLIITPVPAVYATYTGTDNFYNGCIIAIKFAGISWKCVVENCSNGVSQESAGKVISKLTNGFCN